MGYGDPYHRHALKLLRCPSANCFHCDLPFTDYTSCYGCKECDYYIHQLCQELPIKLRVPLHDQHLLTLFEPPANSSSSDSPNLCHECQNPCLGCFTYQCTTCQFFFHLKCLFTLNHDKHQHPLYFKRALFKDCKICGSYIHGSTFSCTSCKFDIHHECSFIPLEIKHHHVHKLTLRHNFPEECDQVYCDLCEDRDGEMDRTQSYYYCKDCDYIAHVICCIAEPNEDVVIWETITPEYPLRLREIEHKHPFILICPQCSNTVSEDANSFNCTTCNVSMDKDVLVKFIIHPLWRDSLEFICKNSLFRCDACGNLGKGSRITDSSTFDLHLECFALPGKLEHESHPNHPLYLRWLEESKSQCCSTCRKEMDPQLWFYFCQECDYAAHIDCVAHDLLLTLRSSIKNQPDFCAIIEPDESSFKYQIADMRPPKQRLACFNKYPPMLDVRDSDLGTETDGYELPCPKCDSLIPTQAGYSSITHWKSSFLENSIGFANDQTPSESEPLSFLNEQMIDELCCSICNQSIFPPTYSCASCKIFFHKSCAELPRKIFFNETTYVLMAPPFPEGLSNCTKCKYPICSWAYLSSMDRIIFDVQCATEAPLVNPTYHNHVLRFLRASVFFQIPDMLAITCNACKNMPEKDEFMMVCRDCNFSLHPGCGLLPAVIKHKVHQHPLELATDLGELDCEYFCDVCEEDLNPDLWAYRCMDICGIWATSHVSCVITSKKKSHFKKKSQFSYDRECCKWTEEKILEFRRKVKERGIKL